MESSHVAVVIPSYNSGTDLLECIESLYNQEYQDWHAFVIDGASPDIETQRILEHISEKRVTVIREPCKRGLAAARNTGFQASESPLILSLDADDILLPKFLTETVPILDSMPEIDCVFTIFEVFGIRSGIMRMGPPTRERMHTHQCIPATGVLMRREVCEKVGGYCEDKIFHLGNEDWDFWIRAMEAGCKPYEIEKPLYRYRTSPNSLCTEAFYVEHKTRQHLIERHPFFFANRSVTRQLLADGYALSSDASLMRGEKARAIRMAFREICLRPISTKSWRRLLRILCPDFFVKTVKRLKLT